MSLSLIVGPPNSGRVAEVVSSLRERLDEDPVLVVPTADDVARFERELCGDRGAIGASIRVFRRLLDDLAGTLGLDVPPALSSPQRLALVRAAIRSTPLRLLGRSARRPGFATALDSLIAELQTALVKPADLAEAAAVLDDGDYEDELARLFGAYVDIRDRAGRSDSGALAEEVLDGLRLRPDAWADRPVFLYGFDDLTQAQLEILDALAQGADVTVAVTYEDRAALVARATMLATLRDRDGQTNVQLERDETYTDSALLRHLDRCLFDPDAEPIPADDGLTLLETAGSLGEAEAIGVEIARLLASGASPDEIVVTLRHPTRGGRLVGRVLERLGIPTSVGATTPLAQTAVGRGLRALCRAASDGGTAEDLHAHLRADPAFPPERADWVERTIARGKARTAEEAVASWKTPPRHLVALRSASGPTARLRALAGVARALAEDPYRELAPAVGERGLGGPPFDPVELRAGMVAAELLGELAAVGELPGCEEPDLPDAVEAIEAATVPLWRGSAEGRVRIVGPYRARVRPARFVFCASLQEGEFPWHGASDPLLGEERRARLGIPALRRTDQATEERYLFAACVSRPSRRLYVSWRSSDDDGAPLARSPYVDELLDLVEHDGTNEALRTESATDGLTVTRGLAQATLDPSEAPTPRELARALAAAREPDPASTLGELGVPSDAAERTLALLRPAMAPAELPGPLRVPAVMEDLGARKTLSASSLESWLECPYRWFVDHELHPQRLEPEADPLWVGGVVHGALERLYAEAPGEDAIPRPGDVARWKQRLGEHLAEVVEERGGVAGRTDRATALARARAQVEAFLDAEAASETELRPRPDLLERRFGFDGDDDPGPLSLGGELTLRGVIDRIDLTADGTGALVRDYKTGSVVPGADRFEQEGSLQIQLYVLAARERFGLDPIGGLYQPLGGTRERQLRGMVLRDDERLAGLELKWKSGDRVESDEFDEELRRARELARERAERMRRGEIDRAPLHGRCPSYCVYQPICRLERSLGPSAGNGEAEER